MDARAPLKSDSLFGGGLDGGSSAVGEEISNVPAMDLELQSVPCSSSPFLSYIYREIIYNWSTKVPTVGVKISSRLVSVVLN